MNAAKLSARFKSLFIDYLVITAYAIVLFALNISVHFIVFGGIRKFSSMESHVISFIMLVFPVFFYFFITESKGKYASIGKRYSKIHIDYKRVGSFSSIIRNILKLLPWQLAHIAVIEGIYNDFSSLFVMVCYILSLILPLVYILMVLFRKDHRHLPDLLAGSIVVAD